MDQTNERLVFDRIVHNCCEKREKPQYFLVSPKLLPGMRAMDDDLVTVLLVINGPGITNKWDFSKRDLVVPSVYYFQRTWPRLVLPCVVLSLATVLHTLRAQRSAQDGQDGAEGEGRTAAGARKRAQESSSTSTSSKRSMSFREKEG